MVDQHPGIQANGEAIPLCQPMEGHHARHPQGALDDQAGQVLRLCCQTEKSPYDRYSNDDMWPSQVYDSVSFEEVTNGV